MLLQILLLSIVLRLSDAASGADAESSPKQDFEDLERIVENLVERRIQDEREKWAIGMKELEAKMEAKDKEMEAKVKEMEVKLTELEDRLEEEKEKPEKRERELTESKHD